MTTTSPAGLAASQWTVDAARRKAAFTVTSLGRPVTGTVPITDGTMGIGAGGRPAAITGSLDLSAIGTGNPRRDRDLRKPRLLDLDRHPVMTFAAGTMTTTPTGWQGHRSPHCRGHPGPARRQRRTGLTIWSWWYSFIANVLGSAGQTPGPGQSFVYEDNSFNNDALIPMWKLGYNGSDGSAPQDAKVVQTVIRYANFDYVTGTVHWYGYKPRKLPPSLYLKTKPAFFGNLPWPWVTPENPAKLGTLPALERFDAIQASLTP